MRVEVQLDDGQIEEHNDVYIFGVDDASGFLRIQFEREFGRIVYYHPDTVCKVIVEGGS